ncbi:hypothetical protein LL967_07795 [Xanthomonas campestris pv. zinniae]|nr:hypothetical protein [Xanthomonas campestris pv. zinniae]
MIEMLHNLKIPGRPLDEGLSGRMHRVFLYKFFRGSHAYRKPIFDVSKREFSEKKLWNFNLSGPYIDDHLNSMICDRGILLAPFFKKTDSVFWFEGGRMDKKHPHNFFCAKPEDLSDYFFDPIRSQVYSSGLLYIFDTSFCWFIRVRDSLVASPKDQSDYVFNLHSKLI